MPLKGWLGQKCTRDCAKLISRLNMYKPMKQKRNQKHFKVNMTKTFFSIKEIFTIYTLMKEPKLT